MIELQSNVPRETLEGAVDDELKKFDEWFQGLGNDPLVKGERAIIKTYLAWKLGVVHGQEASRTDPV
jgi:hypothetical protein